MILFVILAWLSVAAAAAAGNGTQSTSETPTTTTKELLKASETGDPTKVEIVKQIRRLNEDGSYTVGYEADDGTFKIESRDVQGNVKGTFGYIDQDGEIKRVTYSSSSDSTPAAVPVTTTTPSSPSTMIVRMNKTISSTTRRPTTTLVYPNRGSYTTRGTVIQPIPRRRTGVRNGNTYETTTEKRPTKNDEQEETTTNILNLYKPKVEDSVKTRTQVLKPMPASVNDDLVTKQTTTKLPVLKSRGSGVEGYGQGEKVEASDVNKATTIRRELTETSYNPRMVSLQQSTGDDSTDVYGSHLSLGTVRPLFTTTSPRPRLVPIHSIVAARQQIQQQYQERPIQEEETTIEASTGRVFHQEAPVHVMRAPVQREHDDQVYHQQPIYRRPATAQFRTSDYLRDNPDGAVPIGNQRPFLNYEYQSKILEPQPQPQFIKVRPPPPHDKQVDAASSPPYNTRLVTRIIPVPVDERGVPIPGFETRFANPYKQPQAVLIQPRYDPKEEMFQISAPVSTRDLKRLLQILILRQNRLQSLMDVMPGPSQPYLPLYRNNYRYHQRPYQDEYDYRYDMDMYQEQPGYENPYESQRYVPRKRYTRPHDTVSSSTNRIDESSEYLPPDIREALLLKMLILAINPEYLPTPAPLTELTTAPPPRKQVRNVQILGEEGSMDDTKRPVQRNEGTAN